MPTILDDSQVSEQLQAAIVGTLGARMSDDYSAIVPMTHAQIAHLIVTAHRNVTEAIDYVSLYLPDSFPQSLPFRFSFDFGEVTPTPAATKTTPVGAQIRAAMQKIDGIKEKLAEYFCGSAPVSVDVGQIATVIAFAGVDPDLAIKQAREWPIQTWPIQATKARSLPKKTAKKANKKIAKKASRKH